MAALAASAAIVLFVLHRRKETAKGPLPPGPKGLPVIGNALDLPTSRGWEKFTEWGKKYGPLIYVTAFGQPMLIVNTQQAAVDLLEKHGALYSDRPDLAMSGHLVGYNRTLVLAPHGERLKRMRKMAMQAQTTKNSTEINEIEERQTRAFLMKLLQSPEKFREHIRTLTGAIILRLTYGYTIQEGGKQVQGPNQERYESEDPLVSLVDLAMEQFGESMIPGRFLVDSVNFLRYFPSWFPGAGFHQIAKFWRETLDDMCEVPLRMVRKGMKEGSAPFSFTRELLEMYAKEGDLENIDEKGAQKVLPDPEADTELIKFTMASLYGGGAETTVSSLSGFFLAMSLYPETMRKAQEELDRVVGRNRLPTLEDRENLPYVEAICKEVLRWGPVVPVNLPHGAIKDDIYEGYHIPKGTWVMVNIWAILHDPAVYPEPEVFKPERFLDNTTAFADSKNAAFGYGRRICPGKNLAELSLFLSMAMTLHVFDISPSAGETPDSQYTGGTISHPKPFKCSIKPRSADAERLVRQACQE